jgi:methyl-accepting chemotaxis protein
MEKEKKYRRKRGPLVEARSQLRLSALLLFALAMYTLVLLTVILLPSVLRFTIQSVPLEQQFEASREFLFINQRVVPSVVVVALLMSAHFLFLSRRIFGPLKRLKAILQAWSDKEWPLPFHPRKKDFHGELFDSFTLASTTVGSDFRKVGDLLSASLEEVGEESTQSDALLAKTRENCRQALDILENYFPKTGKGAGGE